MILTIERRSIRNTRECINKINKIRYPYALLWTYFVHSSSMHLGESAAYYVNLASRSSFHLRLFQEWFLDDIYCFKLAHRFLYPSPSYLISFMENKLVGWVENGCYRGKKKRERENVKSVPVLFLFGISVIKNLANFLDVRWKKISCAIFHYPLVKNCDTRDGYNACTRSDRIQID